MEIFVWVALISATLTDVLALPKGHGEQLGKHRPSDGHIDIWTDLPTPQQFWEQYASKRKAALFRGAAKQFPAMTLWTDKFLKENFGPLEVKLEHKFEKNEYPVGSRGVGRDTIKSFIDTYQTSNAYIVSQLPDPMAKHVSVLPFATCGSFYERLLEANLWLSSGGSKSLLHRDADNAFNCLLNGTKDWILINPKHEANIPIAKGDQGYGGFATLDVDRVNLIKYKKFIDVPWQYANMTPGDCLFLPYGYWHQVRSYGSKNVAVTILFSRLKTFDDSGCDKPLDYIPLADTGMIWTYPGYGEQTLGNMDPYEIKEALLDAVRKRGKLMAEDLSKFHTSSEDLEDKGEPLEDQREAIRKFGEKSLLLFDLDGKGYIDLKDVLAPPISVWKTFCEEMDIDPANSDQYEHHSISPEDLKAEIFKTIDKVTQTLAENDLVRAYVNNLRGSERWARVLFNNLKGNWTGDKIPKKVVMANLDEQLVLYRTRKSRKDDSGYYYKKATDEDQEIMKKTLGAKKESDDKVEPMINDQDEKIEEEVKEKDGEQHRTLGDDIEQSQQRKHVEL